MKRTSLLICLLLMSAGAAAGDAAGTLGAVWASPTSTFVMFVVVDPSAEYHRCNESQRYSLDLRQPGGEATYQLLLLAKRENYTVAVEGLNTCNPFKAENIRNLSIR
ncbi:MAG: hypothetical protein AB8G17_07405 [Gammaproteobacteria bacterium]